MTNYHLLHKMGWILTQENDTEVLQDYSGETRQQAVQLATKYIAAHEESASLTIHREDGTFEEERTFPRESEP